MIAETFRFDQESRRNDGSRKVQNPAAKPSYATDESKVDDVTTEGPLVTREASEIGFQCAGNTLVSIKTVSACHIVVYIKCPNTACPFLGLLLVVFAEHA